MSQPISDTRRSTLRNLLGVSLAPVAASPILTACGGSDSATSAALTSAKFSNMSVGSNITGRTLSNAENLAKVYVNSSLTATYSDGVVQTYPLSYTTLFQTGTAVPNGSGGTIIAGGYFDSKNQPILDTSVAGTSRQIFSDAPDGTSLLQPIAGASVPGVTGNTVFAVVQFEYTTRNLKGDSLYGALPGPFAVLTLDQNPYSGELKLVKYHNVDTSSVGGIWIPCAGSRSPWNTHLSSEEYPPNAADSTTSSAGNSGIGTNSLFQAFSQNTFGNTTSANPYMYGHVPEVTVKGDGTASVVKHYCMGRFSREVVQVMPDERTCLMGDDWSNGGLFMFIANTARDLSAGKLYVGKWKQTSGDGPGSATLTWILLGSATSAEIKAIIDTKPRSSAFFDVKTTDPLDATYTKINFSGGYNWVKLVSGQDKGAAFLETHRYAALKGGTMGFTKMEGVSVNARDKIAYIAMSRIESAMTSGTELNSGLKVQGPYSGAVYQLNLRDGQKDTDGTAIDSAWVPVDMAAVPALISEDLGKSAPSSVKPTTQDAMGNLASADKIATPDNVKFSEKLRTLFIGEDSNTHVNNFLWAYNVDTKALSRIASMPVGAEATGLHPVDDLNGFTYIMSNFQHAGDWETPLHDIVKPGTEALINTNFNNRFGAAVGYIGGLPRNL